MPNIEVTAGGGGGSWWDADPVAKPQALISRPEPRGIRNNNPLNIEAGSFTSSQPGYQGSDGRFAKFETPDQGVGAAEKLIDVYNQKHGINTIAGIVNRWAPSSDGNNVMAYADSVARDVGVNPNQPLDLTDAQLKRGIVMAMGKFENGKPIAAAAKTATDWWNNDPVAQSGQPEGGGSVAQRFPTADGLEQRKYATDKGALNAGVRGAANGLTLNFFDELMGMAAASGLNPKDPTDLIGLLHGAYKYLSNDPEAVRRYNETVGRERAATKQAEEQHPVASTVGNIAGGVVIPVGGAAGAATLAGRMGRGALVGAGYGAAAGAGEGEDGTDRASKALVGGVVGGAIGGAAAPVVEGVARGVGAAIAKPIAIGRAMVNPQGAAERAVGRAYQDATRIDPAAANRLTPAELGAGGPAMVMDTLGAGGRDLARSAGNISGEARDVLNAPLNARYDGQGGRITDWLKQTYNYPDVHAMQHAIDQVEKSVNKATYARAMNNPAAQSLWDDTLNTLVQAPAVQDAIKGATRTGANRATIEGFAPVKNPFVFDANGQLTMKSGVTPNLAFWDSVKRNLDDTIGKLQRSGEKSAAGDAIELKSQLVKHLDDIVPAYKKARAGAAAFFNAENAVEAGQNYVTQNFGRSETAAALAKMKPHERKLFEDAFVSRYIETLDKIPDRSDVVRKVYNTPAAQQKIETALGPQRSRELEALLRTENIMQQAKNAVQGNSTTVLQLMGAGLAGATGGNMLGYDPTTSGLAAALMTAGKKGVDRRVAEQVARLLTSNDPAVLQRGVQMVARNQRLMEVLRLADNGAARIGGQQSPNSFVPPLQITVGGRAEDNQPTVPRPPGQ